jgi:hypothetical protein
MSYARAVTDRQCRAIAIAGGKCEGAFAVHEYVIPDDQMALPLHPMDINVRSDVATMAMTIRLEQRLRHKHAE